MTPPVVHRIKERQKDDPELIKFSKKVEEGKCQDFSLRDGVLWFRDRLCVADIPELKTELLKEAHDSTVGLSLHNQMTLVRPHHLACTRPIYNHITRSISLKNAPKSC